jgi:hypothetical protein
MYQDGLVLETDTDNRFDRTRSIKYVVDPNLDSSLTSKSFLVIEDCESTITQSWKIFGFQNGEKIDITDRFGYGNPINNNGDVSNQRVVHSDLRLNGGDCEDYQFVNLARIQPRNGAAGWSSTTFEEFSRVEVEASMTGSREMFRGLLKVHLRCEAPESTTSSRENTEADDCADDEVGIQRFSNLNCAMNSAANLCGQQTVGDQTVADLCKLSCDNCDTESFDDTLSCNGGVQRFRTRMADGLGPSATCHDWNSIDFTQEDLIKFPCIKIPIPDFDKLMNWNDGDRAFPNPLSADDEVPDWENFRGWQIHMCGTKGFSDKVGFGLLIRDADYATENILHIRDFDINAVEPTNVRNGDGISVEECRELNPNPNSLIHSPGFSWKSFLTRSIPKRNYEIWVYQYPLTEDCQSMQGVSCETGKDSIIISADSPLYMDQNIRMTFKCDDENKSIPIDRQPPPPSSPFLEEASHELRNEWWKAFLSYINDRMQAGVDVSFQIVNTVRAAFHDIIMKTDSIPMGCLQAIGQDDEATRPFTALKNGVALGSVTRRHTNNKHLSVTDESVILGAMAIDWTTLQKQDEYDWNENDNLLHKIRVGRPEVDVEECRKNQEELESKLPKFEFPIEDDETGALRMPDHDEPLFNPSEFAKDGKRVQSNKGRMTAAHEEFKRAMLIGDLDMRDAVALMGGHGLGFIRQVAEWAPLDEENDCNALRGGPWTTRPHVLDNEYFTILLDLLEVAEKNMGAWTKLAPAENIWNAKDAINWIMQCGSEKPKVPVDTAKKSSSNEGAFSSIDPTVILPGDEDPRFNSNLQMLDSDLTLVFTDDTLQFVREFASREITFIDAFHKAYIKLSESTDATLKPYIHPDGVPADLVERNPEPTRMPTATDPSFAPSGAPSLTPTTEAPTNVPTTEEPTNVPTTTIPSQQPNKAPSPPPTPEPTRGPTATEPSFGPSSSIPSNLPSKAPTTEAPTFQPSPAIPPYPYSVSRWAQFGSHASCSFNYQGGNYRIWSKSGYTMATCKLACENDSRCVSILLRERYTTCILYNKIPSATFSYRHGGMFTCMTYDGGKGVHPLYHWRGWGDCYTKSGSAITFTTASGTTNFQSCLQRCRNQNCLSVTWRYDSKICRLHRHYAATSQNGTQRYGIYAQCYNVLYN